MRCGARNSPCFTEVSSPIVPRRHGPVPSSSDRYEREREVAVDSQIIFSGLCLFLNVKNNNAEMGEPAVVGVGTAGHQGQEHAHHEKHYAFIAFNVDKTDLHAEPAVALKTDDKAKRWRFITL